MTRRTFFCCLWCSYLSLSYTVSGISGQRIDISISPWCSCICVYVYQRVLVCIRTLVWFCFSRCISLCILFSFYPPFTHSLLSFLFCFFAGIRIIEHNVDEWLQSNPRVTEVVVYGLRDLWPIELTGTLPGNKKKGRVVVWVFIVIIYTDLE